METRKNELTITHVLKNGIITFIVTLLAFGFHIGDYYQISKVEAASTILFQDTITLLYFLLVCIFNYLLIEIYNMVYDLLKDKVTLFIKVTIFTTIPIVILLSLWVFIPAVFRINGMFLVIFVIARLLSVIIKQKIDS